MRCEWRASNDRAFFSLRTMSSRLEARAAVSGWRAKKGPAVSSREQATSMLWWLKSSRRDWEGGFKHTRGVQNEMR